MILLLLAAGKGSRMESCTKDTNKCLLLVNNLPIVYYSLDIVSKLPISKAVIVVGYKAKKVIEYITAYKLPFPIQFVYQYEQKGIVHAMNTALPLIDEDILLNLGDEILINSKIDSMIQNFYRKNVDFMCGIKDKYELEEIAKAYSVSVDESNKIIEVCEKPNNPQNGLCGTGYCLFKYETLRFLKEVPVNKLRNQYELCDFINILIHHQKTGYPFIIGDNLININTINDLEYSKERLKRRND